MRTIEVADIVRILVSTIPEQHAPWLGGDEAIQPSLCIRLSEERKNTIVSHFLGTLTYRSRERVLRLIARLTNWSQDTSEVDLLACWRRIAEDHLNRREAYYIKPDRFEDWRRQMHALDEDIPAIASLADHSSTPEDNTAVEVLFEPWPTFMRGDDPQLYRELEQGIGCLHLHLSGAYPAPYYWVGLMNGRFDETAVLRRPNLPDYLRGYRKSEDIERVVAAVATARLIRWNLFQIFRKSISLESLPEGLEQALKVEPSQKEFEAYLKSQAEDFLDYAMSVAGKGRLALCPSLLGERWFLLRALREVPRSGKHAHELSRWVWAYLTAKNAFLSLVQQVEGTAGFDYFEHTFRMMRWNTQKEQVRCAEEIGRFLQESGSVVRLELMVAPQESTGGYRQLSTMADKIQKVMDERLSATARQVHGKVRTGMIVHFIKDYGERLNERENSAGNAYKIYHYGTRDKCLQELEVLVQYTNSESREGTGSVPIIAVDTANRELYCPPEIFAEIYEIARRKLRYRKPLGGEKGVGYGVPVRATYHVGEDFSSLMTGLRRVFEAVYFLQMLPGDRLGHASALGLDPEFWVNQHSTLELPLIDLLDDALFERYLLRRVDLDTDGSIRARLSDLERTIEGYAIDIFGEVVPAGILERAWLMRGDVRRSNTQVAYSDEESIPSWVQLQGEMLNVFGEAIAPHAAIPTIRTLMDGVGGADINPKDFPSDSTTRVLGEYLYDRHCIRRFIRTVSVTTTASVVHLRRVQSILRGIISEQGLVIESNPSSNWLISGTDRHALVPAVQWVRNFPEVPVTLNPDDPAVFATSIENEYFFVYAALTHGMADPLPRSRALIVIEGLRKRSVSASFLQ